MCEQGRILKTWRWNLQSLKVWLLNADGLEHSFTVYTSLSTAVNLAVKRQEVIS